MKLWYVFGKEQDFFDEVYKVWNKKKKVIPIGKNIRHRSY